jgi:hypothetical protein
MAYTCLFYSWEVFLKAYINTNTYTIINFIKLFLSSSKYLYYIGYLFL